MLSRGLAGYYKVRVNHGLASQSRNDPTNHPSKMGAVNIHNPLRVAVFSASVAASRKALTTRYSAKVKPIAAVASFAAIRCIDTPSPRDKGAQQSKSRD